MIVESLAEKNVLINGIDINYRTLGQGMPFLILHGWGSRSEKWQEVGRMIAEKGFKVIIPDLPGFGKSQTPKAPWDLDSYCGFVESFIKAIGLNRFYLSGHSFGGAVAVKYCLNFPGKIEKLFLIDAACFRRANHRKRIFYVIAKIFKIFHFLPLYNQLRKVFYKLIVGRSDYIDMEGVMKDSYLKIIREDLGSILSAVQTPTIIIWGEKDGITTTKEAYKINEEIKVSKLEIIPGVGHSPHRKTPEFLAGKILENLT